MHGADTPPSGNATILILKHMARRSGRAHQSLVVTPTLYIILLQLVGQSYYLHGRVALQTNRFSYIEEAHILNILQHALLAGCFVVPLSIQHPPRHRHKYRWRRIRF